MKGTFEIDFFELCFLAEACIPPQPIARTVFWQRFTFDIHKELSKEQRAQAYEWMMRNDRVKRSIEDGNEDALFFEARYNPAKQFIVETIDGNAFVAFLCEGRYYTDKDRWVDESNIKEVAKR